VILVGLPGAEVVPALAHALVARAAPAYSLWWTPGSQDAAPAAVAVAALPDPNAFVDLLRGAQLDGGFAGARAGAGSAQGTA